MGIIEAINNYNYLATTFVTFLEFDTFLALQTPFLDVFWDEINCPTCCWITQPRSVKTTEQLEQLRRVVAMVPLTH
jgi:hypothetical protein